jgi:hypothetical protein
MLKRFKAFPQGKNDKAEKIPKEPPIKKEVPKLDWTHFDWKWKMIEAQNGRFGYPEGSSEHKAIDMRKEKGRQTTKYLPADPNFSTKEIELSGFE